MPTSPSDADNNDPVIRDRRVVITDPDTGAELGVVIITVARIARRDEGGVFGPMVGLDADLSIAFGSETRPHRYGMSRLVGETRWVQDAHFVPNGFPRHSNGFGARYLRLTGVHPSLEAVLDEAAQRCGLVAAIGSGVALALVENPGASDADQS